MIHRTRAIAVTYHASKPTQHRIVNTGPDVLCCQHNTAACSDGTICDATIYATITSDATNAKHDKPRPSNLVWSAGGPRGCHNPFGSACDLLSQLQCDSPCKHAFNLLPLVLCRKIVQETVDKFGQIDVLVNNASFQGKDVDKFEDITRERLEFTFHSNILAYFSVAQAAVPHMPKGSAIINIASIQGYSPSFGVLDYACTKVPYTSCFSQIRWTA